MGRSMGSNPSTLCTLTRGKKRRVSPFVSRPDRLLLSDTVVVIACAVGDTQRINELWGG